MSGDFKKASEVVSAMFSGIDPTSLDRANSFYRSWKETVGERIASHSKVIDVNKGSIVVEVDHPGWSQEIQFKKAQILKHLAMGFPEFGIRNLVIRVTSECKTPYTRQDSAIGAGVQRAVATEDEVDVPVSESAPDGLKDVLARLRDSIKRGKHDAAD